MTIYHCDACGEETKELWYLDITHDEDFVKGYELCEKCINKIDKLIEKL